ncbi:hypothetical protein [Breoghania sp.]|uniref:hypothetical protein n=1 Tax=Breoghania sp. TaxID=2065378 RepID=UPI0026340C92|nr:hypothetical protein [Breoghania sp.]MDJ0932526.1 hypothetical protein [Breoghania sp.]
MNLKLDRDFDDVLRRDLRESLPHYMIPSRFAYLSAMPQTYNGKVDYNALPKSDVPKKSRSNVVK